MEKVTTIGLDLAKSVFQVHCADKYGRKISSKMVKRKDLSKHFAKINPCLVGMEACGGANYWARVIKGFGHDVRIIPAQYVKPYVKTNKNDIVDAEAISEAVTRPSMRFVSPKSVSQQDIQCVHRIRSRHIKNRTALSNEIRGFLTEYGIVCPKGITHLRKKIPRVLEDAENELTSLTRDLLSDLFEELSEIDLKVEKINLKVQLILKGSPRAKNLQTIPGIGPLAATAISGKISNPKDFKNGRQFSAFLGLVPKQSSSGGKTKLLSTSKRGDPYIRQLLVLGAKSILNICEKREDDFAKWAASVKKRKSPNVATIAVANRIARIAWVIMNEERDMK